MFYVKNVPNWERALRVIAGIALATLSVKMSPGAAGIWLAAGAIGVAVSGLFGFCPACAMVGRRLDKNH